MYSGGILLLSHDARGLGSFRRQCKIAAALRELAPHIPLLLATSCELPAPDCVHVLPLPHADDHQTRGPLLLRYVQEFQPRAILIDKHPFGVRMDFKAGLQWAQAHGIPCFYGLRDILDHPDRVRAEWLDILPVIERFFARVLIYGERTIFDVAQYGLPLGHLVYCGYVCREPIGQAGSDGVLCTVGAGDSNLANHVLRAFDDISLNETTTIVTGPFNSQPPQRHISPRIVNYCPNMDRLWSTHRAVVCLGGYNTLVEALTYGLHIVCVPRIEPRLEQLVRATLFASRGWLHCIHPEELCAAILKDRLATPLSPTPLPSLDGARQAARTLLHEAGLHPQVVS